MIEQWISYLKPVEYILLGYFFVINISYLILVITSFFYIRRQQMEQDVYDLSGLFESELYNPVSILAPAYNEEATIIESVEALLQLQFPSFEVIVINDGSSDRTLERMIDHFEMHPSTRHVPLILDHKPIRTVYESAHYPNLVLVDKENGRKADALNAGLNVATNDLVCAIDSDSILEPDVLKSLLKAFVEDDKTIAVGGIVRVANDCTIKNGVVEEVRTPKSFLGRIQAVEYLRAFLFGRVGWDYLDSLLIISGAFGVFDREAVMRVGGYLHDTVGEDMELVVRLHRYHKEHDIPYRIRFLPEPVCWTEVPEDWEVLGRQRNRWQRGLADTMWRHKAMLFNPTYGRLSWMAMPFFFFLETFGPIIEVTGYAYFIAVVALGMVNTTFALLFLAAAILLGLILSVSAVICEELTFRRYPNLKDVWILSLYAFIENFGYRQIHSWWRLRGLWDFLKGNKEWGVMTRKGFSAASDNTSKSETASDKSERTESKNNVTTNQDGAAQHTKEQRSWLDDVRNWWKTARYWFVIVLVSSAVIFLIGHVIWTDFVGV
jgi:cellulose synthase/poly-beta-1,6-N-acetylglucosamine synthase-like glycosyltransferase